MKVFSKILCGIFSIAFAFGILAGCGGPAKDTLYVLSFKPEYNEIFEEVNEIFLKENPKIKKVDFKAVDTNSFNNVFTSRIQSGYLDVFTSEVTYMMQGTNSYMLPLEHQPYMDEIKEECEAIAKLGFQNILLVTGESERRGGMDYFRQVLPIVKPYAAYLQMEVQPLDTEDYAELKTLGLDAVSVYQETYHPATYKAVHLAGKKMDMRYRMETPDRLGQAGIDKVGIGALLGLYDWRVDCCALALHVLYMRQHYWKTRLSVSFPRLRPAAGGYEPHMPVSDAQLVQLIAAWRIFDHELDLTISTRESAQFRDMIIPYGITAVSAQSSTEPGGYAHKGKYLEQWHVNDDRTVEQVVKALELNGLQAVFHDASTTYLAS